LNIPGGNMKSKMVWIVISLLALKALASEPFHFNVQQFGAKGDGITKETAAVQSAIDACAAQNGGTVYFPAGVYICGSLHLKSHVALFLDHGATIKASPDNQDFDPCETLDFKNAADHETSFFHFALLWAEDQHHITLSGSGVIDGNRPKRGGPKPIALKRCQDIQIKDLTIQNAPNYNISLLGTDRVLIDGVTILNGYSDGIDPDCCRHTRIANCHIESKDDAIVPKASFSLGEHRSTEYLTVTNCILITACNGFKLGTESGGDFKHITVSNCALHRHPEWRPPTSGISLESVDGSHIEDVVISQFVMDDVLCPIFLRLGNRGRDQQTPTPGTLKDIILDGIIASSAKKACLLSGIPGHKMENIMMSRLQLSFMGGGSAEQSLIQVPEKIADYPDADNFGTLPAYGFYIRHAKNVELDHISMHADSTDNRFAVYGEDVDNLQMQSIQPDWFKGSRETLYFKDVRNAYMSAIRPSSQPAVLCRIAGSGSRDIIIASVGKRRTAKIYALEKDVDAKTVMVKE
jgi:polygalacturonase